MDNQKTIGVFKGTILERTLNNMTHHKPSPETCEKIESVRSAFKDFLITIDAFPAEARCKAITFTKFEEALTWYIKGMVLEDANRT